MSVIINFKICDNAKECSGIAVCATGALSWDENDKTIRIDNSKCISCGSCEKACPVEAIRVAKTKEDYEKIKREIEEDPRKISDLFVDRYGAQPLDIHTSISSDSFDKIVLNSTKPVIAEVFNKESIECLKRSIPIWRILKGKDILFKKVELKDDALIKKYDIRKVPSLLLFNKGKLVGKINGFFDTEKEKELKNKLDKLISKIYNIQ
ncbi:MAG: 4Fe-4S dicluster domain-containing protein [Candidatus Nanoarchaeia archaeon]